MTDKEKLDADKYRFLLQFDKSKQNIAQWPKWMRDLAYEASATFPKDKSCLQD